MGSIEVNRLEYLQKLWLAGCTPGESQYIMATIDTHINLDALRALFNHWELSSMRAQIPQHLGAQ